MSNGGFVQPSAAVNIDCIDDVVCQSPHIRRSEVLRLILPCWCEKETAIGSEGEPAEEGG